MAITPFDPIEMNVIGSFAPIFPNLPPLARYNTPITPRDNLLAALRGELPHWMPRNKDHVTVIARVSPDNYARGLVFDSPTMFGGEDMFGVSWKYIQGAGGAMVEPGNPILANANDWKEIIKFPKIAMWDWEKDAEEKKALRDGGRVVAPLVVNGLFERLVSFMDFENALLALIDDEQKEAVHLLLSRLTDMYIEMIDKFKTMYDADMLTLHDDWGSQRAPLFSPQTCSEMLAPHIMRIAAACHERDMFFELHSCGVCEPFVPIMIEAGVDYWYPQNCNNVDKLLELYGGKMLFGVEPDEAISPNVTQEDAKMAAKRLVEKYGKGYEEKPVVAIIPPGPDCYLEAVYEESRKLFGS